MGYNWPTMPRAFEKWTVLRHGPIEKLADNLWRIEGALPGMALKRVFTIARMRDGRLLLHGAMALDEDTMRELEAWGRPGFMMVPNGFHRLDARVYKARYPDLKVIAPAGSRKRIEQVVPVDLLVEEFAGDDAVRLEYPDGLGRIEALLRVRHPAGGETLVFTDAVFNLKEKLPGAVGLLLGLIGTRPGPRVTGIAKTFLVKDRSAYRAYLERLAAAPEISRVIVAHGAVVSDRCSDFLRAAAATL